MDMDNGKSTSLSKEVLFEFRERVMGFACPPAWQVPGQAGRW